MKACPHLLNFVDFCRLIHSTRSNGRSRTTCVHNYSIFFQLILFEKSKLTKKNHATTSNYAISFIYIRTRSHMIQQMSCFPLICGFGQRVRCVWLNKELQITSLNAQRAPCLKNCLNYKSIRLKWGFLIKFQCCQTKPASFSLCNEYWNWWLWPLLQKMEINKALKFDFCNLCLSILPLLHLHHPSGI